MRSTPKRPGQLAENRPQTPSRLKRCEALLVRLFNQHHRTTPTTLRKEVEDYFGTGKPRKARGDGG